VGGTHAVDPAIFLPSCFLVREAHAPSTSYVLFSLAPSFSPSLFS
jgi:hypothetical protein